MTRRAIARFVGVVLLCPIGAIAAFELYEVFEGRPLSLGISAITWTVGYPVTICLAGALGGPILLVQSLGKVRPRSWLPIFLVLGLLGGTCVYTFLFGKALFDPQSWDLPALVQYVVTGLGASLLAWGLATHGPFQFLGFEIPNESERAT
jgi:hypothetical protein